MVGSVGHSTSRAALRDGGTNDGPSAGPMACKGRVAKRRTRQRGDGRQRSYGGRVSTRAPRDAAPSDSSQSSPFVGC
jgi:hypothetical protein